MADKRISPAYRLIRGLVRLFYPRTEVVGLENLPEGAAIVVGNHAQMNGPIVGELYFPGPRSIWCAAQMMRLREVPGYAYQDFWSFKPARSRWFYKILAVLIAPLSVCVFNNAQTIPVYRDMRLTATFRETLARLQEGARVIIFPERNEKHNRILYAFQDRFVDVARYYHRRTGARLPFVPMYVAPRLHKIVLGRPVYYDPDAAPEAERARVVAWCMDEITRLAEALPPHTVVPYRNIPRRDYPKNIASEVTQK